MAYCPPPDRRPRATAKSSDAPPVVAAQEGQKKRRRSGNRGRSSVTRDIERRERERRETWDERSDVHLTEDALLTLDDSREFRSARIDLALNDVKNGLFAERRRMDAR
jgi:hypothetical protein